MLKKLLPVMLALALSAPGLAAPATRKAPTPKVEDKSASVKEAMEAKLGTKISSVTKSPYLGLYEVYADGQILYTDENLTAIIAGTLIDGQTMKNYSAERLQKLTAIAFSELPLDLAVKQVRGDGKRVLVTFEDPNCGYCKRLAKDFAEAGKRHHLHLPLSHPVGRLTEEVAPDLVCGRSQQSLAGLDHRWQAAGWPRQLRYHGCQQEPGVWSPPQYHRHPHHHFR